MLDKIYRVSDVFWVEFSESVCGTFDNLMPIYGEISVLGWEIKSYRIRG